MSPDGARRWMEVGGDVFALITLVGLAYLATNLIDILRLERRRVSLARREAVSVLVPLCGAEKGLYARLAVLCRQDYPAPVQIVCGVGSADDPAIAVARRVARDHPDCRLDVVVDGREYGPNRKISNLQNMIERAEHDTLVMLDSDISVQPGYLAKVVGELQQPGVGAVTCLYYGVAGEGLWSSLSSMSINVQFLTNVISALRLGMAAPCFGATIALSRPVLERIGGLSAFAACLYDDYAIGAAVRSAGLEVAICSHAVGHVCLERSGRDLLDTQFRRARTIRAINPLGNAGAAVTHASSLALVALLLGNPNGAPLLAAAYALRVAQCFCIERMFSLPRQPYLLIPVRDLIAFCVYVLAFFNSEVFWRGARYQVSQSGEIFLTSERMDPNEGTVSSSAIL